ncbi:MAG TPA: histidine phosphatase family protein [Phycisphaerae bacterium]|nr:histidine phosphatase family protein [Phycisphaerae bacterium]
MLQLTIIRHGQADHEAERLSGGWTDSHLTALGQRQAGATGPAIVRLLRGRSPRLISSDLARARETATIISKSLRVSPDFTPALRELCNGQAADLTQEQARQIALPVTHPTVDWVPYPGAENWRAMTERVFGYLTSIEQETETAVVVTHGNSGIAAIHWWLQLGERAWSSVSFQLDHCSITHLTVNEWGERTVVRLNDVAHLSALQEGR